MDDDDGGDDVYRCITGLVSDHLDRGAKVSPAHHVVLDHHDALDAHLRDQGLARFQALLKDRRLKRDASNGVEWFAEHARAQLAAESAVDSKPRWLAWLGLASDMRSSTGKTGPPRADGETFMAFWGQDARSARRAVQSLQLDEIRSVAHILLNKCLVPHLEWLSYQRDDVELTVRELPPTDVWPLLPRALQPAVAPPRAHECWATLEVRAGAALANLRERRMREAKSDEAAVQRILQEVGKQLLALDPLSTIEVAQCDGRPGRYSINQIMYKGHVVNWGGVLDPHTNVDEIVQMASAQCSCC